MAFQNGFIESRLWRLRGICGGWNFWQLCPGPTHMVYYFHQSNVMNWQRLETSASKFHRFAVTRVGWSYYSQTLYTMSQKPVKIVNYYRTWDLVFGWSLRLNLCHRFLSVLWLYSVCMHCG